mmetsp:Transcript_23063/g.41164  ORF Transcript_23063/g.41164 Transcript_23063/m.41164 type:complete len:82 (-) Transcript_23063:2321-2566(-)
MRAFMHAIRQGNFSKNRMLIKGDSASTVVDHVAATIQTSGGQDPRMDESNNKSFLIKRQLQSYKKVDPKTKHQKAIPSKVY